MTSPQPLNPTPPIALCLGGLDPSAGAGLLRDVMTLQALGVHPMAVSTAETMQNGLACLRVEAPSMDPVKRIEALGPHLAGRWGVKLGMAALDESTFLRLAATLKALDPPIRIWDPILAPSAGVGLHDGADLRRMADVLLKTSGWVVSPNRGESAAAAGLPPDQIQTAEAGHLARPWLERGAKAVWLKGGHAPGPGVQDLWITEDGITPLPASPRLPGQRRGTGCTLAAAWLGLRLLGRSELAAAGESAERLRNRWSQAFAPGGAGRPLFAPEALAGPPEAPCD
ncbi:MAG: bifunctional hydroxymethylpyrimidine kinase/phosphomethylpyrimidine kinase [Holophagaceae bacterium]|nr:bifunctional hydroxymethylpyrimidine kinase/phosphomethylpyrimidine kinase [Holophagaceae bacterium]